MNKTVKICGDKIKLTPCAADHLSVLKSLKKDQLNARYPLACKERWGDGNHCDGDKDDGCISLRVGLQTCEPCELCGSDGPQFFSFCLNRMVNEDRVKHCTFCGKCFYFRPGCMQGCTYCHWGEYYICSGEDIKELAQLAGISISKAVAMVQKQGGRVFNIKYVESACGCNVPSFASYEQKGLASEGYWGY